MSEKDVIASTPWGVTYQEMLSMATTIKAQSIVGSSPGRPIDDFYPTPFLATEALLDVEVFEPPILEPACGDGSISKVLEHYYGSHNVVSTDLHDHGYGYTGKDFIQLRDILDINSIITNPPFKFFEDFILAAYRLNVKKFAFLGKLAVLEGAKRSSILEETGLSRVWVFRKRLTLSRGGSPLKNRGMIAFAWFVWDRLEDPHPPEIGWI
jgi:hypothetical protein